MSDFQCKAREQQTQPGYSHRRACLWCGDEIPEDRLGLYCSDSCHRNSRLVEPCAYCGLPADTVDHVIPQVLRYQLEDFGGWRTEWPRITNTVPACRECNSMAGAEVFDTLAEKRRYIHSRLERKYKEVLRTPRWDEDEIEELGPRMQQYVRASQELADLVRARLRWSGSTPSWINN